MEFSFIIRKDFTVDPDGFMILDGNKLTSSFLPSHVLNANKKYSDVPTNMDQTKKLAEILNRMGEASAKAQELRAVITCYERVYSNDVKVFLKVEDNRVMGFLKTGKKNLFYRDYVGNVKQITPLCVLDFYVHESVQRGGIGKQLFEKMLENENKKANMLAYDRPSPKLISFLKKHYNLVNFIPQNNNFVIYQQFFENPRPSSESSSKIQKTNNSAFDNKFSGKNNITTALSPGGKREDFSKIGKQLMERKSSHDEIPNMKEINNKKNDPYVENQRNDYQNFAKGKQNSMGFAKNSRKDEFQLNDIQNKILQTEKELSDVQNKLSNMQLGFNQPVVKKTAPFQIPRNDEKSTNYSVKPPWATSFTTMNAMHTTSNSYGHHYAQQYYNK